METRNREFVGGGNILTEREIDPQEPQPRVRTPFQELSKQVERVSGLRTSRPPFKALRLFLLPFLVASTLGPKDVGTVNTDVPQPQRNSADWIFDNDPLEVPPQWLIDNHPNVQAAVDLTDAAGRVIGKVTAVNNTVIDGLPGSENATLYFSACDPVSEACQPYNPIIKSSMENVGYMIGVDYQAKEVDVWGEGHIREGDTKGSRCSLVEKICQDIPWPYGNSGLPRDLFRINSQTYLGNIANYEQGGVGRFFVRFGDNKPVSVQAIKEAAQGVNLRSAGWTIEEVDPVSGKIKELASSFASLYRGLDASTINPQDGTSDTGNYLAKELGYAVALTKYNNTAGEHFLTVDPDSGSIKGGDVDKDGKPTGVNYKIDFVSFLDQAGIPNLLPGEMGLGVSISALWAGVDNQGKVHIWFIGDYATWLNEISTSHAFIGHFVKETDPNKDPKALFRYDLGPADRDVYSPYQKEFKPKMVKGQPAFEFTVSGNVPFGNFEWNYGGRERFVINPDFSPPANPRMSYPNNGLEKPLPPVSVTRKSIYLPFLTR